MYSIKKKCIIIIIIILCVINGPFLPLYGQFQFLVLREKSISTRNLKTNYVSIMCYKVLLTRTINELYKPRKYNNINQLQIINIIIFS